MTQRPEDIQGLDFSPWRRGLAQEEQGRVLVFKGSRQRLAQRLGRGEKVTWLLGYSEVRGWD